MLYTTYFIYNFNKFKTSVYITLLKVYCMAFWQISQIVVVVFLVLFQLNTNYLRATERCVLCTQYMCISLNTSLMIL